MEKPPFVQLEEGIAGIFRKERERTDEMRRDARHLGADVAIANARDGVATAFLGASRDFPSNVKLEFLALECESMKVIGDWLMIAADVKSNLNSLDPVWVLDQVQLNLKRALDEFRPRLM